MTKFAKALLSSRFFLVFSLHLDKWPANLLLRKGNDFLLPEPSLSPLSPYLVDGELLFEPDGRMAYGSSSSSLLAVPYVAAPRAMGCLDIIFSPPLNENKNNDINSDEYEYECDCASVLMIRARYYVYYVFKGGGLIRRVRVVVARTPKSVDFHSREEPRGEIYCLGFS